VLEHYLYIRVQAATTLKHASSYEPRDWRKSPASSLIPYLLACLQALGRSGDQRTFSELIVGRWKIADEGQTDTIHLIFGPRDVYNPVGALYRGRTHDVSVTVPKFHLAATVRPFLDWSTINDTLVRFGELGQWVAYLQEALVDERIPVITANTAALAAIDTYQQIQLKITEFSVAQEAASHLVPVFDINQMDRITNEALTSWYSNQSAKTS
jgi:hypothetical protein